MAEPPQRAAMRPVFWIGLGIAFLVALLFGGEPKYVPEQSPYWLFSVNGSGVTGCTQAEPHVVDRSDVWRAVVRTGRFQTCERELETVDRTVIVTCYGNGGATMVYAVSGISASCERVRQAVRRLVDYGR